jgi:hypothetical protein
MKHAARLSQSHGDVLAQRAAARSPSLIAASKHADSLSLLRRGLRTAADRPDGRRMLASVVARVMASSQPPRFKEEFAAEVRSMLLETEAIRDVSEKLSAL